MENTRTYDSSVVISSAGADAIPSRTGFGRPHALAWPNSHPLQHYASPVDRKSCPEKHALGPFPSPPPSFSSHSLYLCASYTLRPVINASPRVVYKDPFPKYLYYPLQTLSFVGGLFFPKLPQPSQRYSSHRLRTPFGFRFYKVPCTRNKSNCTTRHGV